MGMLLRARTTKVDSITAKVDLITVGPSRSRAARTFIKAVLSRRVARTTTKVVLSRRVERTAALITRAEPQWELMAAARATTRAAKVALHSRARSDAEVIFMAAIQRNVSALGDCSDLDGHASMSKSRHGAST